jgi:hypothetical protein
VKSVAIQASTNGSNNVLVAAVSGKVIRVLAYLLSFSGSVNAKFQSNQSTDLTGLHYGIAGTVAASPPVPVNVVAGSRPPACFETAAGEALTLNLSAGTPVGGWLVYELLPPNLSQQ